ncbi:MAG TPA: hypothetical protein VFV87_22060 [Pirellulaceae bacterium]|nr:hypothetical protein [Pirellulaceae bacterium]
MIRSVCLSLAAVALLSIPAQADAYWGYYGWGGGPWSYGYNYNFGTGYLPPPPYYSIFPPVYYSPHVTMRHYGASPYAWPAGFSPTAYAVRDYVARPAEPLMVVNPYVRVENATAPAVAKSEEVEATPPLAIDNPHVASVAR